MAKIESLTGVRLEIVLAEISIFAKLKNLKEEK